MTKEGEKRTGLRVPVRIYVRGKTDNDSFCSIAKDISISGILLATRKTIPSGARIRFSFVLQHKISVGGEVVRVKKMKDVHDYNYGIRFLDVDPKSKVEIEELVKSQKGH